MSRDIAKSPCYRELEEAARRCAMRPIRLTGQNRRALGLLLLEDGASDREIEHALAGLPLREAPRLDRGRERVLDHTDRLELDAILALELARTRKTRLPCALLLIGIRGGQATDHRVHEVSDHSVPQVAAHCDRLRSQGGRPSLADQAATSLEACLQPSEIPATLKADTLALILPGVNVCKAKKRAEEVLAVLVHAGTGKAAASRLALGLAVCHAYDNTSAEQLLALARAELERAAGMGHNAICHATGRWQDDSCQVTVEERAQLFSFLQKEACS